MISSEFLMPPENSVDSRNSRRPTSCYQNSHIPTAWTVHVADNPGPEAGYLTMILQDGVFLAMNSIITTRGIVRAHYPEIAKSKGD
jgi:hypothetical protein